MQSKPSSFGDNKLLALLPAKDRRPIEPHLDQITLETGQVLFERGDISYVYFPGGGVISKVVEMDDGTGIEAGMIGNEGMVPLCLFLELDRTPFRAVVQNPGRAWRVKASAFKTLARPGSLFHSVLLRFAAAFMAQVSQSAGCNRLHPLEQRYCRWLLMTQDRLGADELVLKQAFAAAMLGVRRMSITPAAKKLQQAGLIRYSRGRVTILDRRGLEAASCECYHRVQAVYDGLLRNLTS